MVLTGSIVFAVAALLVLWAAYQFSKAVHSMGVALRRTERKFRKDVKQFDGLTAGVDGVVKIIPMLAYHERVLATSVSQFVEAVNKSGATMAKDSFTSYDELDKYRISVENEYIQQGVPPGEARARAVEHITGGMTMSGVDGLGIGA